MLNKWLNTTQSVATRRFIILLGWVSLFTWVPVAYIAVTLAADVKAMATFIHDGVVVMRKLTQSFWNTPNE
jgi:hypothetical protein